MPTIHCRNDLRRSGANARALASAARKLLVALGQAQSVLSLTLVGDEAIRALNRKYRGKDKPTDVLSFALHEDGGAQGERLLGDVVISVETARRQAEEYGAPLQRELERLLIHGILHLVGHDHHEAGERRRMRREERRLAACIGMPWPY